MECRARWWWWRKEDPGGSNPATWWRAGGGSGGGGSHECLKRQLTAGRRAVSSLTAGTWLAGSDHGRIWLVRRRASTCKKTPMSGKWRELHIRDCCAASLRKPVSTSTSQIKLIHLIVLCSKLTDGRTRSGGLCVKVIDAWRSVQSKWRQCFPDIELWMWRCRPYHHHHLLAAVSILGVATACCMIWYE